MTVRDKKSSDYEKMLRRANMQFDIKVGVMGTEASAAHMGGEDTVADIATRHEFGIDVPQRSFIRETVDVKQDEIQKVVEHFEKQMLDPSKDPQKIANMLGLKIQFLFQERISNNSPPFEDLAPMTIELKGSSKPLVNTGQLKSAITYTAEVKGKGNG